MVDQDGSNKSITSHEMQEGTSLESLGSIGEMWQAYKATKKEQPNKTKLVKKNRISSENIALVTCQNMTTLES